MSAGGEAPLRAPFPWFGGKSRVARDIWARFGDVANYVEPFAGSLAVLLARPHPPRTETVNDRDAHLANFWRAVKADPDGVAFFADWPVNEVDLHARHRWLVTTGAARVARLEHDPDYYDAQAAGWWVWGVCAWIASGWCQVSGGDPERQHPHLSTTGIGVHRIALDDLDDPESTSENPSEEVDIKLPRSLPHLRGNRGIHRRMSITIVTFRRLSERLRHVRVACGDWTRVMGGSVTFRHGLTGVFLDPPYPNRERSIVSAVDDDVSTDVRAWAVASGDNPLLRIALCGYDGECPMPPGWTCLEWKAAGGYGVQGQGRGRENARREREGEGRGRWLTADELADLYAKLKELAPAWVLPMRVLAETGLRLGELFPVQPRDGKSSSPGLRWKNVKFAESAIIVSAARVETTKRHARRVDVDVELLRALAKHRETVPHRPEDLVFPDPWTYQIAERVFTKAVQKLEWEHAIVHDLRRTFIVHALSAGVQVPVVQRAVGHRTAAMTIRYARLCPDVSANGIAAAVAASQRAGQAGREAQAVRALVRVVQ